MAIYFCNMIIDNVKLAELVGTTKGFAKKASLTPVVNTTGNQVYTDFVVPTGAGLYEDNAGKLVYRVRPRFNSEYVWNINELGRIGATQLDYHTKEQWFSQK